MKKLFSFLLLTLYAILMHTAVVAQPSYKRVLLISEVGYNTPGDDAAEEWIELFNLSSDSLSLDTVRVGDEETTGDGEGMLRFPKGAMIGAGETALIAQTAVGFRALFGFAPDFEMVSSDTTVPDMRPSRLWATGDVALGNDGDEVLLLQDNVIIDAVNYGDRSTFFAPSVATVLPGQSIVRQPANCDSDSAADWQTALRPTPGAVTLAEACRTLPQSTPSDALSTIGEIQGPGAASPFVNQTVSFRGIMTGYHADTNASGITFYTLFVQEPLDQSDGDPATSDGLAVFLGRKRPFTKVGDQLRVTGQVIEFFGLTEIDDNNLEILVESANNTLPEPVVLQDPSSIDGEALESMRVLAEEVQVVGATLVGCSFFVLPVGSERPFLRGDEDGTVTLPLAVLHHDETDCASFPNVKFGDRIPSVGGPLTYHFEQFKIVTETNTNWKIDAARVESRTAFAEPQPGQISIATFNMLNHFDDRDDTGSSVEPKRTPEQIGQKQQKIRAAIVDQLSCPTVIGVQEVEKAALLAELAQLLLSACGFLYQVVHLESPDARGIDVALMVDPTTVTVLSSALMRTCSAIATDVVDPAAGCPTGQYPLFSRPPLRVEAQIEAEAVTFVVNHFKSKRGGEAETAARRLAQARFLNAWAADRLAENPTARLVVMGDFNDVEQSTTMRSLTANGTLHNVLLGVPAASRYSFVFAGASQLIDGILLSPELLNKVERVDIRHVNADYPAAYEFETTEALLPLRSSDHDLPIVLLDWRPPAPLPAPTSRPSVWETAVPPQSTTAPLTTAASPRPPRSLMPVAAILTLFSLFLFQNIRRRG